MWSLILLNCLRIYHFDISGLPNSNVIRPITHSALYEYLADKSPTSSDHLLNNKGNQQISSPEMPVSSSPASCSSTMESCMPLDASSQNSASNFLKSIVKTIIKNKQSSANLSDNFRNFASPDISTNEGTHIPVILYSTDSSSL